MPTLTVRSIHDVPPPSRATKAAREAQLEYEGFIQAIGYDVGELELSPAESIRGAKVRLRRASSRLGRELDIWDANGRVYFRVASKRRRSRGA